MGLMTKNYTAKNINLTLPEAYAQITHVSVSLDGTATACFSIQQNREMISAGEAIETRHIRHAIDKDLPIFAQLYTAAKGTIFNGWEDDIVEDVTEDIVENIELQPAEEFEA